MTRTSVSLIALLVMLTTSACWKDEAATEGTSPSAETPSAASSSAETPEADRVARIPILPGYKYYVGGPGMKQDKYGRFRLKGFNGEVQQPPSRGMIFAAKVEGDQMEYRVWGNGVLLALHRGVMRDGLFWQEFTESYRLGKVVAREKTVNNDETERVMTTLEDIDPETGEVIRTTESSSSYLPPAIDIDAELGISDDEKDEEDAGTAPAAAPAAPAPKPAE